MDLGTRGLRMKCIRFGCPLLVRIFLHSGGSRAELQFRLTTSACMHAGLSHWGSAPGSCRLRAGVGPRERSSCNFLEVPPPSCFASPYGLQTLADVRHALSGLGIQRAPMKETGAGKHVEVGSVQTRFIGAAFSVKDLLNRRSLSQTCLIQLQATQTPSQTSTERLSEETRAQQNKQAAASTTGRARQQAFGIVATLLTASFSFLVYFDRGHCCHGKVAGVLSVACVVFGIHDLHLWLLFSKFAVANGSSLQIVPKKPCHVLDAEEC